MLDTFVFADPTRTLELNPSEVDRLRTTAERVILGKLDVRELLRNRPKPKPPSRKVRVPAAIRFDDEASATATLVEIVAEDRPGLLYDLASAISSSGGNIEVVLIDTQAHRAIDVFYVTVGGRKLTAESRRRWARNCGRSARRREGIGAPREVIRAVAQQPEAHRGDAEEKHKNGWYEVETRLGILGFGDEAEGAEMNRSQKVSRPMRFDKSVKACLN